VARVDPVNTGQVLDSLRKEAVAQKRGRALENLASELLEAIPGVTVVERNLLTPLGNEEVDLVLSNQKLQDGLGGFNHDVLVECKSTGKRTDSPTVREFGVKLQRRGLDYGVLIALGGLTGEDSFRAAVGDLSDWALQKVRMVVVVERELRGIRSGEHLANVLERKRIRMVAGRRLLLFTDEELADLDPGMQPRRGAKAIRDAIRTMHRDATKEVLDLSAVEDPLGPRDGVALTREILAELDVAIENHRQDDQTDPLWRDVREVLVRLGATIARILDEHPPGGDVRHAIEVNVFTVAEGRLRATAGSRLWDLLTNYYLGEIASPREQSRDSSIYVLLAIIVEEMLAIDNIDPRDVYGYPEDPDEA
jgi:Restriction endonuclease